MINFPYDFISLRVSFKTQSHFTYLQMKVSPHVCRQNRQVFFINSRIGGFVVVALK